MRLATVGEEVLGLRDTARYIRVSEVICALDDRDIRSAYIVIGKATVCQICVERKYRSSRFGQHRQRKRKGYGVFYENEKHLADVRKRYTLGYHLVPIDSFFCQLKPSMPRDPIKRFTSRFAIAAESDEGKPHTVWFCVGSSWPFVE